MTLYTVFPTYTAVTFWKVWHKSNFALLGKNYRLGSIIYVHTGQPSWNLKSGILEPECPTTCVVTKQYFSSIFVSLHFYSWKEIMAQVKQYYSSWVPTSIPHHLHITYTLHYNSPHHLTSHHSTHTKQF